MAPRDRGQRRGGASFFGLYAPSGRLPMSWPAGRRERAASRAGGASAGVSSGAAGAAGAPLFPAGFGLVYR